MPLLPLPLPPPLLLLLPTLPMPTSLWREWWNGHSAQVQQPFPHQHALLLQPVLLPHKAGKTALAAEQQSHGRLSTYPERQAQYLLRLDICRGQQLRLRYD